MILWRVVAGPDGDKCHALGPVKAGSKFRLERLIGEESHDENRSPRDRFSKNYFRILKRWMLRSALSCFQDIQLHGKDHHDRKHKHLPSRR